MHHADVIDRASELEAAHRAQALAAHAARARYSGPAPEIVDGVACCASCCNPIPAARLAAVPGVGLCVLCQREREGG